MARKSLNKKIYIHLDFMENIKNLIRICPVCNEKKGINLHTQKFSLPEKSVLPAVYDVVSCQNCGFCFADTSATQKDYDQYYNEMSKYEDKETGSGGGLSVLDKQRMKTVADLLSPIIKDKTKSVVDIGCANGGMLTVFSENGYTNLTGIDISQKCVDNVRELGFNSLFGGIFTLDNLKGKTFDCLIVSHVMEHIRDLQGAAKNLVSLVNDDGLLYIEVPDASRYPDYYFVPYYYFDCEHINHINITALKNLFQAELMECVYFEEKTLAVSNDKDYPVLRAVFKKNSAISKNAPLQKDEKVMASIKSYIELSKKNDGFAELEKLIESNTEIIVWGAGMYTLRLLEDSPLSKCNIKYFIDKDSNKQGNKINHIEIISPDILQQLKTTPIIIASAIHGKAIKEEITRLDGNGDRKTIIL